MPKDKAGCWPKRGFRKLLQYKGLTCFMCPGGSPSGKTMAKDCTTLPGGSASSSRGIGVSQGRRLAWVYLGLPQQVFELKLCVGLCVAVLHDDGGVQGEAPILPRIVGDSAGASDDDGVLRDDQRFVFIRGVHLAAQQVVNRRRAVQDGARAEDGAPLHRRSEEHTSE